MAEYQVPQFIEVEDKIIGPLTLKQFIYLAGGAGLCIIFYFYLPIFISPFLIIPAGGLALALAFYKVNGKPFVELLESAVSFYLGKKLFLWKREGTKAAPEAPKASVPARGMNETRATPRLTSGKLHQLAWSLDVTKGESSTS